MNNFIFENKTKVLFWERMCTGISRLFNKKVSNDHACLRRRIHQKEWDL